MMLQQDMFLNLPVLADLVAIRDCHQEIVNKNLCHQNLKRREWHYAMGQEVLIKETDPNKLQCYGLSGSPHGGKDEHLPFGPFLQMIKM
eukprot:14027222-Ditylum_brightwellii.AAC.2